MKRLSLIALAAIFSWAFLNNAEACTGLKCTPKDKHAVHGRTFEFGVKVDTSIVFVPRGYSFTGKTPQGDGLKYISKYAAVGAIAVDDFVMLDGLNEKGLSVGTFYFPGYAEYAQITKENQGKALSPADFSNWIVTQFATLDEVKQALSEVVIAPTIIPEMGSDNTSVPLYRL